MASSTASSNHVFGFETAPETLRDGVHRLPPSGICILVAGGGIGGMMLACEAWRQGHDVRVLEKAKSLEVIGDTFGLLPPALVTFRLFPSLAKDFAAIGYDATLEFHAHSGRRVFSYGEADWNYPDDPHPARGVHAPWIVRRAGVLTALEAQARRLGIPVDYGCHVVEYDEDETKGFVRTADGRTYFADLVVAADGVGTKSHAHVAGSVLRARTSGYAAFRGMIPMARLANVSQEAKDKILSLHRPEFRIYIAKMMHMNVIVTPDFVNYVLTHEDTGDADESWRSSVSAPDILKLLDEVPDWDPALREVIAQTPPGSIVDWKLLWRDPQPRWCSSSGRVMQLGDAAHSFLPTSGNGATQAVEDALSLSTCLRLGGRENVVNSVRAHVKLRYERVSTLQRFGFANRQILHYVDPDELERNPGLMTMKMGRWIWTHDPVKYARENYRAALDAVIHGTSFENTNLPPGHKFVPWTIAAELEREEKGLRTELMDTGDWS